jgi:hypothetical protein
MTSYHTLLLFAVAVSGCTRSAPSGSATDAAPPPVATAAAQSTSVSSVPPGGSASPAATTAHSTPSRWSVRQRLFTPDAVPNDCFGASVALRGDTLVVGAPKHNGRGKHIGAAYVFVRHGRAFELEQKLEAPDAVPGDLFGLAVAVDGETILVGAPSRGGQQGAVFVFTRHDGSFRFEQKLASGHRPRAVLFGFSVSMSGDAALVGEPGGYADVGSAYVFRRRDGRFELEQELAPRYRISHDPEPSFLNFGYAVSIEGGTLFVGAYYYVDVAGPGLVYVFTKEGQVWTERQALQAIDPSPTDGFGRSLSQRDATLLVAGNDALYLFTHSEDGWTGRQRLELSRPLDVALASNDLAIALGGHVLVRRESGFQVAQRIDLSDKPLELDVWRVDGNEMYAPRAVAADGETLVHGVPSAAGPGSALVIGGEL